MNICVINRLIRDLYETTDLDDAMSHVARDDWAMINVAKSRDGSYLFLLARFGMENVNVTTPPEAL